MKIHNSTESLKLSNPIATMGVFDGVHLGHQALIKNTVNFAKKLNKESVILTFSPHPRIILNQDPEKLKILTSLNEKIKIFDSLGIDNLIILPFNLELASLNAEKFIEEILVKLLNISRLVVGYNHRFGKDGITFEELEKISKKYSFDLQRYPLVGVENQFPSSSQIRNFLLAGDIVNANNMLGYYYGIEGNVIDGNKIGRIMSYPTANLLVSDSMKLIPPNGVYATFVKISEEIYNGMTNVGLRPTVNSQKNNTLIEVHILDFKDDIYGEKIEIQFVERIRDERKFPNQEALKKQIDTDKKHILKIFEHNKL